MLFWLSLDLIIGLHILGLTGALSVLIFSDGWLIFTKHALNLDYSASDLLFENSKADLFAFFEGQSLGVF